MGGKGRGRGLWPGLTCFPTDILIGPCLPCDTHLGLVARRYLGDGCHCSAECVGRVEDALRGLETRWVAMRRDSGIQASAAIPPCSSQACPRVPTPTLTVLGQHVGVGSYKVGLGQGPRHVGSTTQACMGRHIRARLTAGGHTVAASPSRLTTYIQRRIRG